MRIRHADRGFAELMALPVTRKGRPKLRDRVPGSDAAIIKRGMKYGNASPEFKSPHVPEWAKPLPKGPRYPAWTTIKKEPCLPFESGRSTLPGMEMYLSVKGVYPKRGVYAR